MSIIKETLTKVFFCEFCYICKNNFLKRTLLAATPVAEKQIDFDEKNSSVEFTNLTLFLSKWIKINKNFPVPCFLLVCTL